MYKWYFKIYLKSGVIIKGMGEYEENNSSELAKRLFMGSPNTMNGIVSMSGGQLLFLAGEVAAFEIDCKQID